MRLLPPHPGGQGRAPGRVPGRWRMSKNTVKSSLTPTPAARRKRAKRVVENAAYSAFAGRILTAYGRRVAAGDIEALPALAALRDEIEATVRLAVTGLRKSGY